MTGTHAALVDTARGYAIRLELGDRPAVDLIPTHAVRVLEQLADAVTEWSELTESSAVLLAVLERARDAIASDRILTELLTREPPRQHRRHDHTARPYKRGA